MKIRAMIIDDNPLAIDNIENMLKENSSLEIIGKCTSPYEGLINVLDISPDVVFLEVKMKELNGIELVKIIRRKIPNIQIVFISKCEKHAVSAFEIGVLDYILKPISQERVVRMLCRLKKRLTLIKIHSPQMVGSFRRLYFRDSSHQIVNNIKWRTKKTGELFGYLLHHQNKSLETYKLIDLLWPDIDSEKGSSLLYSSIYQIRKMMKKLDFNITIENNSNGYLLNLNDVSHDVRDWKIAMDKLPGLSLDTIIDHLQVIKMYKGEYLVEHDYPWAFAEKRYLNTIWWDHVENVVNVLVENERIAEVVRIYKYAVDICPSKESGYLKLMQSLAKLDDTEGVIYYYKKLKHMLLTEFEVIPEESTIKWFNEWAMTKNIKA